MQSRTLQAVASPKLRDELVEGLVLAMEIGLGAGLGLEISLRVQGGKILTTPARAWPPVLQGDDLVLGTLEGNWSTDPDRLPPHFDWHLQVYKHSDSRSVVFSQPPHGLVLSDIGAGARSVVPEDLWDITGGIVSVAPDELPSAIPNHGALRIAGYGVLTHGTSVGQALGRAQAIDKVCQLVFLKHLLEG